MTEKEYKNTARKMIDSMRRKSTQMICDGLDIKCDECPFRDMCDTKEIKNAYDILIQAWKTVNIVEKWGEKYRGKSGLINVDTSEPYHTENDLKQWDKEDLVNYIMHLEYRINTMRLDYEQAKILGVKNESVSE